MRMQEQNVSEKNMKILIDANILLDVLQAREPHLSDSIKIWKICETGQTEGVITTLSFANLVYVMRKELLPEQIEDVFVKLGLIFHFADLTEEDLKKAAGMCWDDFEDAAIRFIKDTFANGDYERLYAITKDSEKEAKGLLVQFESDYPKVLKTENVSSVLKTLRAKRTGQNKTPKHRNEHER